MQYASRGGLVKVFAGEVALSSDHARIEAANVRVYDSQGHRIATADRVTAFAPLFWVSRSGWIVNVDGIEGVIERKKNRRWNIEDLMPAQAAKPSEIAYSINLRNARLLVSDEQSPDEPNWTIRINSASAAGKGGYKFASLSFDVPREGSADLYVEVSESGNSGTFSSSGFRLARLRRYLASAPEFQHAKWLKELDLKDGSFAGRATWDWTAKSGLALFGNGTAQVHDLRFRDKFLSAAEFAGSFNQRTISGSFKGSSQGASAQGMGRLEFGPEAALVAKGTLDLPDYEVGRKLFPLPALPKNAQLRNLKFNGSVNWKKSLALSGELSAESARVNDVAARGISAMLQINGKAIHFGSVNADVEGGRAAGDLTIANGSDLSGRFELRNANPSRLAKKLTDSFVPARLNLVGLIRGTIKNPELIADAEGSGTAAGRVNGRDWSENIAYRGRFAWLGDAITVQTLDVNGAGGRGLAKGSYDIRTGRIEGEAHLQSVDLSRLPIDSVEGIGFAQFSVSGTAKDFKANGRVETYSAKFKDYALPMGSAMFAADNDAIRFSDIQLHSGASLAKGSIRLDLGKNRALTGSGELSDVTLSSFTDGWVKGLATGTWALAGTANDPKLSAAIHANFLVADKVQFDGTEAKIELAKSGFSLLPSTAKIGEGTATVFGRYDFEGNGAFHLAGDALPLSALGGYTGENAIPAGSFNATADAVLAGGRLDSGTVDALIKNFTLNSEMVGSGTAHFDMVHRELTGHAELGSLAGYMLLDDARYNLDSKEVGGTLSILNVGIPSLRRIGSEWLAKQTDPDAMEKIAQLDGTASATVSAKGKIDSPDLTIGVQTDGLMFSGKAMGKLDANAERVGKTWTISNVDMNGGPFTLRLNRDASNRIEEDGEMHLDGEINHLDLAWLASLVPHLGDLRGVADLPFTVSGKTASPTILASVNGQKLAWRDFAADAFDFGPFMVQDRAITADQGTMQVRGLALNLESAHIPFRYPFTVPPDEPLDVVFRVPAADIDTLDRFFGGLDTVVTEGKLNGATFAIHGTPADWTASGEVNLAASRMKFKALDNVFDDVAASAKLNDNLLEINATGRGEAGGSFDAKADWDLKTSQWTSDSKAVVQDLGLRYRFENGSIVRGSLFANLAMSGDLMHPLITGEISADQGLFDVRGEFASRPAAENFAFDPKFDVRLTAQRAEARSGLMTVKTAGTGALKGSLNSPDVEFGFTVSSGTVKLISGPLKLEPGGTAQLTYRADEFGGQASTLPVNLRASTVVTSVSDTGVQRYDVTLYISGDLFGTDELNIDVQSDPPGLTKDDFIGIVGQKQLFGSGAELTGNFQDRLKDILSVVTPVFLSPLTESLQKALGLDYIVLNFGQGTVLGGVILGKTLGKGFSLEYRQPLSEDPTFQRLDQLALTYRPPVKNPLISRMTLGAALNRQGELSFSLTYSRRFTSGRSKRR